MFQEKYSEIMEEVDSCPFARDHPDYAESQTVLQEYFIRHDIEAVSKSRQRDFELERVKVK